jgi:uncharacterized protein DUF6174
MRTGQCICVAAVALGLGAATAACSDSLAPEAAFALNRAKWSAQHLDTYTFEYHRSCGECLPEWLVPVRITVVNGEVIAVVGIATGDTVPPPAFRLTIDSLFAQVANILEQNPYRFTITYDRKVGYPMSMSVDYDRQMVDDEGGFSARLVLPAQPLPASP